MFKDIKDGYVMLHVGGRCKTVNIATFSGEPALYAKVSGGWYSALLENSKTRHGYNWQKLNVPAAYNIVKSTAHGVIQVECVAAKVAKKLGVKK